MGQYLDIIDNESETSESRGLDIGREFIQYEQTGLLTVANIFDEAASGSETQGESELKQQFGGRAEAGIKGERFYHRALVTAGLDRFPIFQSLNVPGRPPVNTDVDRAILNGVENGKPRLVLIDVKAWEAGRTYWSVGRRGLRGLTPIRKDDGTWALSRSMELARERYRLAFGDCDVSAFVAFVPTTGHSPASFTVPTRVKGLTFPGGIPSMLADESFSRLYQHLGEEVSPVDESIINRLRSLERR